MKPLKKRGIIYMRCYNNINGKYDIRGERSDTDPIDLAYIFGTMLSIDISLILLPESS